MLATCPDKYSATLEDPRCTQQPQSTKANEDRQTPDVAIPREGSRNPRVLVVQRL